MSKTRNYEIKIPFIGYDIIYVEIEGAEEEVDDDDYEELALEKAQNEIYEKFSDAERFETFPFVEGSFSRRFTEIKFKQEITEIFDEEEDENDE